MSVEGVNQSTSSRPAESFPGYALSHSRTSSPNPSNRMHNTSLGGGSSGYNDHHTVATRQKSMAKDFQKETTTATLRDLEPLKHDIEKLKSSFRELERKNKFVSPDLVDTTWRELLNLRAFVGYTTSASSPWKTWSSYHEHYLKDDGEQFRIGSNNRGTSSHLLLRGQSANDEASGPHINASAILDRSRSEAAAFDLGSSSDNNTASPIMSSTKEWREGGTARRHGEEEPALSPLNADDLPVFSSGTPKGKEGEELAAGSSGGGGVALPLSGAAASMLTPEVLRGIISHEVAVALKSQERQLEAKITKQLTSSQQPKGGCYNTRNGSHCCEINAEIHLEANRRLRIYLDEANRRNALHHELQRKLVASIAKEQDRLVTAYDGHLATLHHAASPSVVGENDVRGKIGRNKHSDPHLIDDRTFSSSPEVHQRLAFQNQKAYESPSEESENEDYENISRIRAASSSHHQHRNQHATIITTSSSTVTVNRTASGRGTLASNLNVNSSPPNVGSGGRAPILLANNVVSDRFREKAEALVSVIKEDPYLLDLIGAAIVSRETLTDKLKKDLEGAGRPSGVEAKASWLMLLEETASVNAESATVKAVSSFNAIVEDKIVPRLNDLAHTKIKEIHSAAKEAALRYAEGHRETINTAVATAVAAHTSDIKTIAEEASRHVSKKVEEHRANLDSEAKSSISKVAESIKRDLIAFGDAETSRRDKEYESQLATLRGTSGAAALTHESPLAILLPLHFTGATQAFDGSFSPSSKQPGTSLAVSDFIFLTPLTNKEVASFVRAASAMAATESEGHAIIRLVAKLAKRISKALSPSQDRQISSVDVLSGSHQTLGLSKQVLANPQLRDHLSSDSDDDHDRTHQHQRRSIGNATHNDYPWLASCSASALRPILEEVCTLTRGSGTAQESFEVTLSWQRLIMAATAVAETERAAAAASKPSAKSQLRAPKGVDANYLIGDHWKLFGHPFLTAIRIYWNFIGGGLVLPVAMPTTQQPTPPQSTAAIGHHPAGLVDDGEDDVSLASASPQAMRPRQVIPRPRQVLHPSAAANSLLPRRGISGSSSRQSSLTSHQKTTIDTITSTKQFRGSSAGSQDSTRPLAEAITHLATALENGNSRRVEAAEEETAVLAAQQRVLEEEVRVLTQQKREQDARQKHQHIAANGGGAREAARLFSSPTAHNTSHMQQFTSNEEEGLFHRTPSLQKSTATSNTTQHHIDTVDSFYGSNINQKSGDQQARTQPSNREHSLSAAEIADELQYRVQMSRAREAAQQLVRQNHEDSVGVVRSHSNTSRQSAQSQSAAVPRKVTVYHHHHSYVSAASGNDPEGAQQDHRSHSSKIVSPSAAEIHEISAAAESQQHGSKSSDAKVNNYPYPFLTPGSQVHSHRVGRTLATKSTSSTSTTIVKTKEAGLEETKGYAAAYRR